MITACVECGIQSLVYTSSMEVIGPNMNREPFVRWSSKNVTLFTCFWTLSKHPSPSGPHWPHMVRLYFTPVLERLFQLRCCGHYLVSIRLCSLECTIMTKHKVCTEKIWTVGHTTHSIQYLGDLVKGVLKSFIGRENLEWKATFRLLYLRHTDVVQMFCVTSAAGNMPVALIPDMLHQFSWH